MKRIENGCSRAYNIGIGQLLFHSENPTKPCNTYNHASHV